MKISARERRRPTSAAQVNGIPPIDTQRAVTTVLVADGETTVIGGIYVSTETVAEQRTPGLSRIPLLGWLFKRERHQRHEPGTADLHHASDYEVGD